MLPIRVLRREQAQVPLPSERTRWCRDGLRQAGSDCRGWERAEGRRVGVPARKQVFFRAQIANEGFFRLLFFKRAHENVKGLANIDSGSHELYPRAGFDDRLIPKMPWLCIADRGLENSRSDAAAQTDCRVRRRRAPGFPRYSRAIPR